MELFLPSRTCNWWIYSGAGNRFLLTHSIVDIERVPKYCSQAQVDGLLCVQSSDIADAKLVIFNNDGSGPSMCGNGLRCVIAHLAQRLQRSSLSVETDQGIYRGEFLDWEHVIVDMTLPGWDISSHLLVHLLPEMPERCFSIHTGVPHAVMFVDDVHHIDVHHWGSFLRYHEMFAPSGVNVNFVQATSAYLLIRTYERGLERESMACGTGALASALVATSLFSNQSEIKVQMRSGVQLNVFQNHERIYVEGPVQCLLQEGRHLSNFP